VVGYIPDTRDLVWLDFSPHSGHEQGGRRPALVLSPRSYNARAKLVLACPITTRVKGYTFEVELPNDSPIKGVVLADQIKCLDFSSRALEPAGFVSQSTVDDVLAKLNTLLRIIA
jgi:mRNA interferase MazF